MAISRQWFAGAAARRWTDRLIVGLGLLGFGNGRRLAHLSFAMVLIGYAVAFRTRSAGDIPPSLLPAVFAAFSALLYGGIYVLNDIVDLAHDRQHPVKQKRLVASGRISVSLATASALALIFIGLAASFLLSPLLGGFACLFLAVNLLYTLGLKRLRYVDLAINTLTYPLRTLLGIVLAGGAPAAHLPVVLGVGVLAWTETTLRRHYELTHAGTVGRPVLRRYRPRVLLWAALLPGFAWPVLFAYRGSTLETAILSLGLFLWLLIFGVWLAETQEVFRQAPRARSALGWLALYVLGR
ncbi:MAG: UbiA family prenyltransferase [Candidatus Bipolaricaulota bacterium]